MTAGSGGRGFRAHMGRMPLGVKLIALLCTFGAVFSLAVSFFVRNRPGVPLSTFDIAAYAVMTALLYFVAVGLWMLRRWAVYAYLAHFCLNAAVLYTRGLIPHSTPALFGILLQALLIVYLLSSPRARAALQ